MKKKEGFPAISDTGIMDIFLGGEGFSFKIAASNARKEDSRHFFKVDNVTVSIQNMSIKLRKSNHKILFAIFKPILFRIVRPALETVLVKQIREAFLDGDEFAHEVHLEAKKAEEAAKNDPENKQNAYSRYMDAVRTRMDAKKAEKKKKPQRGTKFQTPATLRNSLFPNIILPGAVSTKATEYEDLAKQGERWESPVFSIGKAPQSTDIPKPASITRKPHETADGKLVGPQPEGGMTKNGVSNGAKAGAAYPVRGFADEIDNSFSKKNGADGPKIQPGTAFDPRAV